MEFNHFTAVLDTNVLAPMPVADTLFRLAEEPAFYLPRWSEEILRELERTFLKWGRTPQQIDRRMAARLTRRTGTFWHARFGREPMRLFLITGSIFRKLRWRSLALNA